jgi:hypothetical protein
VSIQFRVQLLPCYHHPSFFFSSLVAVVVFVFVVRRLYLDSITLNATAATAAFD